MDIHKIDDAEFSIELLNSTSTKMLLQNRSGGLYLALSGILLTDANKWYNIPMSKIEYLEIDEHNENKMLIGFDDLEVVLNFSDPIKLKGLRDFLMPFIGSSPVNA